MSNASTSPGRGVGRVAGLLAALVALVAVALGAGAVAVDQRAKRSRTFCTSCHTDSAPHGRAHAQASCQSCHATTFAGRIALSFAGFTHGRPGGHHAPATSGTCASCHQGETGGAFATTPGHQRHARTSPPTDCVRCHGASMHGRGSPSDTCMTCHASARLVSEPRDAASCVRCHEFSANPSSFAATARTGVRGDAPRVDGSRIHGGVDCRQCHNPHRAANDPNAAPAALCTQCHRGDIAAQVRSGPAGHQTCLGCHAVHADRAHGTPQCDRCHVAPSPRPVGAAAGRSNTPGFSTTALRTWVTHPGARPPSVPGADWQDAADNPANATLTHRARCASCHRPHTWVAQPTDCRGCHTAQATSLGFETPHGRNGCLGCHNPHGPHPDATACAQCHANETHLARNAPPLPHRNCLSCHQPHAPVRPTATTCAQCHQPMVDRMAHGPAPHQNCLSCHTPHGPPRPQTPQACATCHATVTNWFATQPHPAGHRCVGCHANHDFSRPSARASCQRCHQDLASHRGSHLGECVTCHAPHAPFPQRPITECRTCHTTQHLAGPPQMQAGHQRCNGCHRPHQTQLQAVNQCGNCHRQEVATAPSWPAGSPHAGQCAQCHDPHRDDHAFPVCANCHQAQNTPNHFGRHPRCVMCHVPHREHPEGGRAGWWTRCAECHRDEGAGARAATSPTHRTCSNCHQRPGLVPPTCVTCHATIPSQLLHAVPHHNTCLQCHDRHGNAPPTRARCQACHTDRANHFPDANTCQTCHPFAAGARRQQ